MLSRERHIVPEGSLSATLSRQTDPRMKLGELDNPKRTSFDDRLSAAANAKKAELEKFRARAWANDPAVAERQAARQAISVARDACTAERNASRLAAVAREAAEQTPRDAAAEAERAAHDVALQGERKAPRDARYAVSKARSRKR
jgi:Family of unknown function (DUF6481)